MSRWYAQLQSREQRMLAFGALALIALAVYALVWEPLATGHRRLSARVAEQHQTLQWMQQAAHEVRLLRRSREQDVLPSAPASLLAAVDESARTAKLSPVIKRVEPQGATQVRVWVERAPFDQLVVWLDQLQASYGLSVTAASVERQDDPGTVNARLTLGTGTS